MQKCSSCHGNGIKISIQPLGPGMVQQVQRVCPDCSGEGESKYAQWLRKSLALCLHDLSVSTNLSKLR